MDFVQYFDEWLSRENIINGENAKLFSPKYSIFQIRESGGAP